MKRLPRFALSAPCHALLYRLPTPRAIPFNQYRKFTADNRINDEMGKEKTPQFTLKVPKGTKDWDGKDMVIREKIFNTITEVFKRHGAVTIDT